MNLPLDIAACHAIILAQEEQIVAQQEHISVLRQQLLDFGKEIECLKVQLNQNSKNSHKPPSSDGPKKKPGLPKKKGGKKGGQEGHKGKTLKMVDAADHYDLHTPQVCSCGQDLEGVAKYIKERRQVFDIPPPQLEVTEHINMGCICPNCKSEVSGQFPSGVNAPVQYGNGVKALITLLNNDCQVSFSKIKRFFADVFGYAINEGTQFNSVVRCSEQLQETESVIKLKLSDSAVTHYDETGIRVAGKNHWLHVCSNDVYTYLFAHANRGKKAINSEYSLLPGFTGWAVHDCWASYFNFTDCQHAVCGPHLLRELNALIEQNSEWANDMYDLLMYAYEHSDEGKSHVKNITAISNLYDLICDSADKEEPPPEYRFKGKKPKQTKGRNLLNRLVQHKSAVLAFAKYDEVPFSNNQAERDLRPAKTKLKVAGCFRTLSGAQHYARIQGFISTVRKNQLNVFNELVATFSGTNSILALQGAK